MKIIKRLLIIALILIALLVVALFVATSSPFITKVLIPALQTEEYTFTLDDIDLGFGEVEFPVLARELEAHGITVIHDTLVHDYPSYDAAYDSSRETVKELLAKYPSVKIALDIHRDGIETAEGVRLAPVADIGGKEAAQIMLISGCDDGTMDMPDYLNNFRFACELQSKTETLFPGLTRPILFDYRFYNQDLTDGSLLIEVGSHGNTLAQAKYSGQLIGRALGELLAE